MDEIIKDEPTRPAKEEPYRPAVRLTDKDVIDYIKNKLDDSKMSATAYFTEIIQNIIEEEKREDSAFEALVLKYNPVLHQSAKSWCKNNPYHQPRIIADVLSTIITVIEANPHLSWPEIHARLFASTTPLSMETIEFMQKSQDKARNIEKNE